MMNLLQLFFVLVGFLTASVIVAGIVYAVLYVASWILEKIFHS